MQTFTKDTVPWKLRLGKPTQDGALTREQVSQLSEQFGLDFVRLRRLSRDLDMALSEKLHLTQIEHGPARIERGVRELNAASKELRAVEQKLQKVEDLLQNLKFKNMFSHAGVPNSAPRHLESFSASTLGLRDFRAYLDIMAREALVVYTGMPDKRRISDLRRQIVCVSIFNFWDEAKRNLSYTTAPGTSERGGELVDFVNAVVWCMTEPSCRLSGEVIKAELDSFKAPPEKN